MQAKVSRKSLSDLKLFKDPQRNNKVFSLKLELTRRCNNNCRHCYINLPADDPGAQKKELSYNQICALIDEAASLGIMWLSFTGGEPLLRKDFFDLYLYAKRKGLLVSILTNATLIRQRHIDFFRRYPPRNIEVSVYGVSQNTYEHLTRTKGSFVRFQKGLSLLLKNNMPVKLKSVLMRSNFKEFSEIKSFCEQACHEEFRFDPHLFLRIDGKKDRNRQIIAERLRAKDSVVFENKELPFGGLADDCLSAPGPATKIPSLFRCKIDSINFTVSPEGLYRPCSFLWHPDFVFDLRHIALAEAIRFTRKKIKDGIYPASKRYMQKCAPCKIKRLCKLCPAASYLESGHMESPVSYFCKIAHLRAGEAGKKTCNSLR